jgi:hypothetical protein
MPFPKIQFNSTTGSDTAASGAGPSTALTGSGASTTNGGTTVDLSADNPDLSGVATDGSAALWVSTSTGRQFARITAVNDITKVITTTGNTWGVTASSQTWAIGGERATLNAASSRALFTATGWGSGWEIVLATDQTIDSSLSINGPNLQMAVMRSNVQGISRCITCTADATVIAYNVASFRDFILQDIAIENSNVSKTAADGIVCSGSGSSRSIILRRCKIGHPTNSVRIGIQNFLAFTVLIDCTIIHCTSFSFFGTGNTTAYGSVFHSNGNSFSASGGSCTFCRCLFYSNTNENLKINPTNGAILICDSTFDSASTDNLSTLIGSGGSSVQVVNCNFTKSGGFGIRARQLSELPEIYTLNCNFGSGVDANASGKLAVVGSVDETGTLEATPTYLDRLTANYGPGSAIIGQGYPKSPATLGTGTAVATSSLDIGAFQSTTSGGGGSYSPIDNILIG